MPVSLTCRWVEMLLSLLSMTVVSRKFMDFVAKFDVGIHVIQRGC